MLVYGLVTVLCMLFLPNGVVGWFGRKVERRTGSVL